MADKIRPLVTSRKTGGRVIQSRDLTQEYLAKEMSRRQMVQSSVLGAIGTWLGAGALAGCGAQGPGGGANPGTDAGTNPGADAAADRPPMRMPHLVGMGYHEDHAEAVRLALAETVGLSFVQRGQRVCLKVNTNSGDPFPYSTSPDTIRLVVGLLRDLGAEVFIGDRSFWGDGNTMNNFRRNGIAGIAQELGVPLHVFGDTGALATGGRSDSGNAVDWVDLPPMQENAGARSAVWEGTMRIPAMVAQADHIINLPCLKTHFIATFTLAMKNIIGIINPVDRSRARNLGQHGSMLSRQVAYMNKAGPTVSMNILDGHQALITGGPTPRDRPPRAPAGFMGGQTTETRLVIASQDRVAIDVTGVAVLRTLAPMYELIHQGRIWDNRQVAAAVQARVGITGPEQYDLSGPSVPAENLTRYRESVMA